MQGKDRSSAYFEAGKDLLSDLGGREMESHVDNGV